MLKPYNPRAARLKFFSHSLSVPEIDSLQPTLRWEAFPRDKDRKTDPGGVLARVGEITYDLKIWKGRDGHPDELVYERQGIPGYERPAGSETQAEQRIAEHTIETKLEAETEYFWTVRARFRLDGKTGITKWSYSRIPWKVFDPDPCLEDHIPLDHYHRFKTPAK